MNLIPKVTTFLLLLFFVLIAHVNAQSVSNRLLLKKASIDIQTDFMSKNTNDIKVVNTFEFDNPQNSNTISFYAPYLDKLTSDQLSKPIRDSILVDGKKVTDFEIAMNFGSKEFSLRFEKPLPKNFNISFTSNALVYDKPNTASLYLSAQSTTYYSDTDTQIKLLTPSSSRAYGKAVVFYTSPIPEKVETDAKDEISTRTYGARSFIDDQGLYVELGIQNDFLFNLKLSLPDETNDPSIKSDVRYVYVTLPMLHGNNGQFTYIEKIEPKPDWVYTTSKFNNDKTYIVYEMDLKAKDINVTGLVSLNPYNYLEDGTLNNDLSKTSLAEYLPDAKTFYPYELKSNLYYLSNNMTIREEASKMKEPLLYDRILENYKHVVNLIDYDTAKLSLIENGYDTDIKNAVQVLKSKQAICSEYSILLSGLLRAQGIPTRIVLGFSAVEPVINYKENYHAWNEVPIQNYLWVPVDVTWGDTQRSYIGHDLKHITMNASSDWPQSWDIDLFRVTYSPDDPSKIASYKKHSDGYSLVFTETALSADEESYYHKKDDELALLKGDNVLYLDDITSKDRNTYEDYMFIRVLERVYVVLGVLLLILLIQYAIAAVVIYIERKRQKKQILESAKEKNHL